jgi:hypothetical protein
MEALCGACGHAIDAAQVDEVLRRAFCRPCRRFTLFADAPTPSAERYAAALAPPREIEPMPSPTYAERVSARGRAGRCAIRSIVVQRSPGTRAAIRTRVVVGAVCIALPLASAAIAALQIHLFLGLLLLAAAIRSIFALASRLRPSMNRVVVGLQGEFVRLHEEPIAGGLRRDLRRAELANVEVRRAFAPAPIGHGEALTWDVRLTLHDGESIDLDLRLDRAGHAQFVASRIESALADAEGDGAADSYRAR